MFCWVSFTSRLRWSTNRATGVFSSLQLNPDADNYLTSSVLWDSLLFHLVSTKDFMSEVWKTVLVLHRPLSCGVTGRGPPACRHPFWALFPLPSCWFVNKQTIHKCKANNGQKQPHPSQLAVCRPFITERKLFFFFFFLLSSNELH